VNEELTSVVREYQAGLRAYIRRLGVQSAWVDDMAQEVFLVAFRRWDTYDSERNVGKWLYGIARHLVANELRKGRRKARVVSGPLSEHLLASVETDSGAGEIEELTGILGDCLNKLPRFSQQLLYQRYAEELNASQLSQRFDMSAGAIRIRLKRIRSAVKACIEGKLGPCTK
jgi:RNA polymerase sigma-70 factor, ECF subfamily